MNDLFFTRGGRMYMNLSGKPVPKERRYPACRHSWDRWFVSPDNEDIEYKHCHRCGWTFRDDYSLSRQRLVRIPQGGGRWEAGEPEIKTLSDGTTYTHTPAVFVLVKS